MKEAVMFILLFFTSAAGYLFLEETPRLSKYETPEPKMTEYADYQSDRSLESAGSESENKNDAPENILNRKQRLDKIVSILGLSEYEILEYCESCRIHERATYIYDKNINQINLDWESYIKFKIIIENNHPTLESITRKLEEFDYIFNPYPGFKLSSAGGALGNSEVLGLASQKLNEAEVVKIYEKHVLTSDSGDSLDDWKVDYNIIEISVPDIVDLTSY